MAKKSFRENPALQFISLPQTEQEEPLQAAAPAPAQVPPASAPPEVRMKPLYVETKSRRVQLLMQPSLHDALKRRAQAEGSSLNDWVHAVLQQQIDKG